MDSYVLILWPVVVIIAFVLGHWVGRSRPAMSVSSVRPQVPGRRLTDAELWESDPHNPANY